MRAARLTTRLDIVWVSPATAQAGRLLAGTSLADSRYPFADHVTMARACQRAAHTQKPYYVRVSAGHVLVVPHGGGFVVYLDPLDFGSERQDFPPQVADR